jgi:PAS domain S-box-containing protein
MDETAEDSRPAKDGTAPDRAFRRQELEALLHASRVLASSISLTQSLQAIIAQAASISGIPIVRLFLVEEATQLLRCGIAVGLPVEEQERLTVPVGHSFSGQVAATRRPLAVTDTRNDPRLQHPAHAERYQLVSYLGLPVVHHDRLFGVLTFNTPEPREYGESEIALLTAFAQLAAATLHHAQIHEAAQSELRERRQAEAALQRQEAQYRSLAENLPDTIARFDLAFRCIYVNQQMEAEMGIPAAAALGKTNRELGFPEHCVELWENALRAVLRDGQIHTVECSLPTPRGVREYETRVVPERGPEGAVETFLVINRNITDRKESERALAERTRQLEAVRAISVEIIRELDLGRLLALIVQRAAELVGGSAGAVVLWDEATQFLVPRAWHGRGEWIVGSRGRLGEGLTGTVAARRSGMLINDYATSPYAGHAPLDRAPVVAAVSEPLLYQDRLLGVLTVYHIEPGHSPDSTKSCSPF